MAPGTLKDVWGLFNNKGGVGKTTLSFHLLTTYAEEHPDEIVLAFDMCPQSNLSQTLLTCLARDGTRVDGPEVVENIRTTRADGMAMPQTIYGLLATAIHGNGRLDGVEPRSFLIQASEHNRNVASNIFLVCGDSSLEDLADRINDRAQQPVTDLGDPYFEIMHILQNFIIKASRGFEDKRVVAFVDTNPAFSSYTYMALTAMTKIMVPLNADPYSKTAAADIFRRIYHFRTDKEIALLDGYGDKAYSFQVKKRAANPRYHFTLPCLHLIILNKAYTRARDTKAFLMSRATKAMADRATASIYTTAYRKDPTIFTRRHAAIGDELDFQKHYQETVSDMTGTGIMSSYSGLPISKLLEGKFRNALLKEFGTKTPAPQTLDMNQKNIKRIVTRMYVELEDQSVEVEEAPEEEDNADNGNGAAGGSANKKRKSSGGK